MIGSTGEPGRRRASASKREDVGEGGAPKQGRIEILLVDPHPWTREALARALETACRDFRVLRFDDVANLAQAEPRSGAALVLLNVTGIELADSSGSTAVATVRSRLPGLPVVALSDSANVEHILCAIEQGLSGYIPISLDLRLVVDALRFVAAGGTFVPAEALLGSFDANTLPGSPPKPSLGETATVAPVADPAAVASAMNALTPRERAVLGCLCRGKSNKEVARELGMCEATVKVHVRHIMRKVGASNRTQVALLAEGLERIPN